MNECGVVYPLDSTVKCNRPGDGPQGNHAEHTGDLNGHWVDWTNDKYVAPPPKPVGRRGSSKNAGKLKEMADKMAEGRKL